MTSEEAKALGIEVAKQFLEEEAKRKEQVKEIAKETANTILQQLGGNRFAFWTGAKNFTVIPISPSFPCAGLQFNIGTAGGFNDTGINTVRIILEANDTYTMHFLKERNGYVKKGKYYSAKSTLIKEYKNVYCDQLQDLFYAATNLMTRPGQV